MVACCAQDIAIVKGDNKTVKKSGVIVVQVLTESACGAILILIPSKKYLEVCIILVIYRCDQFYNFGPFEQIETLYENTEIIEMRDIVKVVLIGVVGVFGLFCFLVVWVFEGCYC